MKESNKKSVTTISIEEDVKERAKVIAKEDGRTFNGWVAQLIRKAVNEGT